MTFAYPALAVNLQYSRSNFTNIYEINENKSYSFDVTNADNDTAYSVQMLCSYCHDSFNPITFNLSSNQNQTVTFYIKAPSQSDFYNNSITVIVNASFYENLEANLDVVNETNKVKYLRCEVLPNGTLQCNEVQNLTQYIINETLLNEQRFYLLTNDSFFNILNYFTQSVNDTISRLRRSDSDIYQNSFKILNLLENDKFPTWFKTDPFNEITNETGLSIEDFYLAYAKLVEQNKIMKKTQLEQTTIDYQGSKLIYSIPVNYIASVERVKREKEEEANRNMQIFLIFIILLIAIGIYGWDKYQSRLGLPG